MQQYFVVSAQIPANEALSSAVDIGDANLVALEMPEAWAGTAITFQSKAKRTQDEVGGLAQEDWDNVYDDAGTEVSVTVAANRVVVIGTVTKAAIGALRFLRIRSGSSATPVNQNPSTEVRLICKHS